MKNKSNMLGDKQICPVCLVDTLCIPFECCHMVCVDCYARIMFTKCPICRMKL